MCVVLLRVPVCCVVKSTCVLCCLEYVCVVLLRVPVCCVVKSTRVLCC